MKIIDISEYIEEGRRYYPTLPPVKIEWLRHYDKGHDHEVSYLSMPVHAATHIDAPLHFIPSGASIDKIPLTKFIGIAQVVFVKEKVIDCKVLKTLKIREDIVLFKMKEWENPQDYPYFREDAAEYLVRKKVKLVGVESPSVDRFGDKKYPVHKILLSAGVLIIEGLKLKHVKCGRYFFLCLPLKIKGIEGAPCRAILIDLGEVLNK